MGGSSEKSKSSRLHLRLCSSKCLDSSLLERLALGILDKNVPLAGRLTERSLDDLLLPTFRQPGAGDGQRLLRAGDVDSFHHLKKREKDLV